MELGSLKAIIKNHEEWLQNCGKGKRAKFRNLGISQECLSNTNLSKAIFTKANASWTDFIACKLQDADFTECNLTWANLMGADLTNANFTGAKLNYANFRGCNLTNANFTGCDFYLTNFENCITNGAVGIPTPKDDMDFKVIV